MGNVKGAEWCVLRRLDDTGVAGGHGGGNAPSTQQEGKVPRYDEPAGAPGPANDAGFMFLDGDDGSRIQVLRQAAEVAHGVDEVLNVVTGLGEKLATVEGFNLGNDLLPCLDSVCQPLEVYAALVGRQVCPVCLGKCPARSCDGAVDVFRLQAGNRGEGFPCAGVVGLKGFTIGGLDLLAGDECAMGGLAEEFAYLREWGYVFSAHDTGMWISVS